MFADRCGTAVSRRTLLASLALLFAAGPRSHSPPVWMRASADRLVFWRFHIQLALETTPSASRGCLSEEPAERGWREPEDVEILLRSAEAASSGESDHRELIGIPVDVLVISGNGIAVEAKRLTRKVPIVMLFSQFPARTAWWSP